MSQQIKFGKEFIRISPKDKKIVEYSKNDGSNWHLRCSSSNYGDFINLVSVGKEILAITTKGIYYSTNSGINWHSRCSSSNYGEFMEIVDNGKELLGTTSKGLYYSTNSGSNWHKRS